MTPDATILCRRYADILRASGNSEFSEVKSPLDALKDQKRKT